MIGSDELERAERILQVVYVGGLDRQLEMLQIRREDYEKFYQSNINILKRRYGNAWHEMDPRLEPAIATVMFHMFSTGLMIGRNEGRRIE